MVENCLPGIPAIGALPYATAGGPHVVEVWITRHAHNGGYSASCRGWTQISEFQILEDVLVVGRRLLIGVLLRPRRADEEQRAGRGDQENGNGKGNTLRNSSHRGTRSF